MYCSHFKIVCAAWERVREREWDNYWCGQIRKMVKRVMKKDAAGAWTCSWQIAHATFSIAMAWTRWKTYATFSVARAWTWNRWTAQATFSVARAWMQWETNATFFLLPGLECSGKLMPRFLLPGLECNEKLVPRFLLPWLDCSGKLMPHFLLPGLEADDIAWHGDQERWQASRHCLHPQKIARQATDSPHCEKVRHGASC